MKDFTDKTTKYGTLLGCNFLAFELNVGLVRQNLSTKGGMLKKPRPPTFEAVSEGIRSAWMPVVSALSSGLGESNYSRYFYTAVMGEFEPGTVSVNNSFIHHAIFGNEILDARVFPFDDLEDKFVNKQIEKIIESYIENPQFEIGIVFLSDCSSETAEKVFKNMFTDFEGKQYGELHLFGFESNGLASFSLANLPDGALSGVLAGQAESTIAIADLDASNLTRLLSQFRIGSTDTGLNQQIYQTLIPPKSDKEVTATLSNVSDVIGNQAAPLSRVKEDSNQELGKYKFVYFTPSVSSEFQFQSYGLDHADELSVLNDVEYQIWAEAVVLTIRDLVGAIATRATEGKYFLLVGGRAIPIGYYPAGEANRTDDYYPSISTLSSLLTEEIRGILSQDWYITVACLTDSINHWDYNFLKASAMFSGDLFVAMGPYDEQGTIVRQSYSEGEYDSGIVSSEFTELQDKNNYIYKNDPNNLFFTEYPNQVFVFDNPDSLK